MRTVKRYILSGILACLMCSIAVGAAQLNQMKVLQPYLEITREMKIKYDADLTLTGVPDMPPEEFRTFIEEICKQSYAARQEAAYYDMLVAQNAAK